jgi:hypothetical protein
MKIFTIVMAVLAIICVLYGIISFRDSVVTHELEGQKLDLQSVVVLLLLAIFFGSSG